MQANENRIYNSIEAVPAGEEKLYEVRKHPFGIIMLYVQALFGLGVALGLMFFLASQFLDDSARSQYGGIILLIAAVATGITLVVLFLASVIYHQSYIIMTNKNVTQVLQQGLFKRRVSELALGNIEDVTAEQHGLIQTLFNFGTLRVETAGEVENFEFPFCPKPNYCGKMLLDARQHYLETSPVSAQMGNNRLDLPPAAAQPLPPTPEPPVPPASSPPVPPPAPQPPQMPTPQNPTQ